MNRAITALRKWKITHIYDFNIYLQNKLYNSLILDYA
jgi:hypothetical protein